MNQINDDENDERIVCKYGASCYQKNKAHHEKYKHPSGDDQHEEKEKPQIKKPTGPLKQQKLNIFFKKVIPKTEKVEKLEESKRDEDNVTSSSSRANTTEELENTRNQISSSPSPDHTQNFENIGKTELSPSLSSNISSDDLTNRIKTEISPSSSGSTSEEEHGETEDNEAETSSSYYEISEEDSKILIKKLFLVDMPPDFYSFWSFCKKLSPENPKEALSSVGLTLVGPYDVIAGELKENSIDSSEALIHWRYYYDPPEFQTIIKGNENCFHMGYFRDDPNMPPVFVAYNSAKENPHITPVAENIFGAVDWYVSRSEKASNPFKKIKTSNLKSSLHDWAKTHKFTLDKYSPSMQKRNKAAVCKTFQQVGIVVPYDKKTEVGYRPLSENTKNLKHILNEIVKAKTKEERIAHFNSLYSVVNWANIAMDEGDFGTNLELGLNLFSYETDQFNSIILSCLGTAYNLLGRNQFEAIIKAHLNNRRKGDNLSVIKKSKK